LALGESLAPRLAFRRHCDAATRGGAAVNQAGRCQSARKGAWASLPPETWIAIASTTMAPLSAKFYTRAMQPFLLLRLVRHPTAPPPRRAWQRSPALHSSLSRKRRISFLRDGDASRCSRARCLPPSLVQMNQKVRTSWRGSTLTLSCPCLVARCCRVRMQPTSASPPTCH
jgi:hypothetical protein